MGKPGIPCTICTHEKRAQIDMGIVYGLSVPVVAARFKVSSDAIYRHRKAHLTATQRAAILHAIKPSAIDLEKLQATESEGLLAQLVTQRARLLQQIDVANEVGDSRAVAAAENAITKNLALVGKLLGQLVTRHEVRSASILISPDYIALRAAIMAAIRPYPDAARAVAAAIQKLEAVAAAQMAPAVPQAAPPDVAVPATSPQPLPPPY